MHALHLPGGGGTGDSGEIALRKKLVFPQMSSNSCRNCPCRSTVDTSNAFVPYSASTAECGATTVFAMTPICVVCDHVNVTPSVTMRKLPNFCCACVFTAMVQVFDFCEAKVAFSGTSLRRLLTRRVSLTSKGSLTSSSKNW